MKKYFLNFLSIFKNKKILKSIFSRVKSTSAKREKNSNSEKISRIHLRFKQKAKIGLKKIIESPEKYPK